VYAVVRLAQHKNSDVNRVARGAGRENKKERERGRKRKRERKLYLQL